MFPLSTTETTTINSLPKELIPQILGDDLICSTLLSSTSRLYNKISDQVSDRITSKYVDILRSRENYCELANTEDCQYSKLSAPISYDRAGYIEALSLRYLKHKPSASVIVLSDSNLNLDKINSRPLSNVSMHKREVFEYDISFKGSVNLFALNPLKLREIVGFNNDWRETFIENPIDNIIFESAELQGDIFKTIEFMIIIDILSDAPVDPSTCTITSEFVAIADQLHIVTSGLSKQVAQMTSNCKYTFCHELEFPSIC